MNMYRMEIYNSEQMSRNSNGSYVTGYMQDREGVEQLNNEVTVRGEGNDYATAKRAI